MTEWLWLGFVVAWLVMQVRDHRDRRRRLAMADVHYWAVMGLLGTLSTDLRGMAADTKDELTALHGLYAGAVTRLVDLELKPAEIVTVEIPTVPDTIVQRGLVAAGPSPKDMIHIHLMDGNQEEGCVEIERRRRAPQVQFGGHIYQATAERPDGWRYQRVRGH